MTDVREPQPGETLAGRYVVEREIGRGGFGVVFLGRHAKIDRSVAIKVLLRTFAAAEPTAVERFRREAVLAASLTYPNTVQLHDYGETDEGVFYIVMELLEGQPLTDVIKADKSLPAERAVHIVRQMLHTLMEAHARGIIHRDIKPDNIMLTPLEFDRDYVKVMDFGIAKMSGAAGRDLTGHGIALGTPRYMPVEQLTGKTLTPATDLYAVGLVLYEMLTGRPAFTAESTVDIAVEVLQGDGVHLDPVQHGLPPALCAVVEKACCKDVAGRYQSARELLDALDEAGRLPTPAAPVAVAPEASAATVMLDVNTTTEAVARTQLLDVDAGVSTTRRTPVPDVKSPDATALRSAHDPHVRDPAPPQSAPVIDPGLIRLMLGMQGVTLVLLLSVLIMLLR